MVRRRAPRNSDGFTLLEVLVALLIGMIGLIGTVAIQQTMLNTTALSNEAGAAMRLATQKLEELNAAVTTPGDPGDDPAAATDELRPRYDETGGSGTWRTEYYGGTGDAGAAGFRYRREWRVSLGNDGGTGSPYNITVKVTYGNGKIIQLDSQRFKSW